MEIRSIISVKKIYRRAKLQAGRYYSYYIMNAGLLASYITAVLFSMDVDLDLWM